MVPPAWNWTVPVGVPVAGGTGATVAVKLTPWPKTEGFAAEVTAVVVLAGAPPAVVKDHNAVAASALPETSVTPPAPPATLAV